MRYIICLMLILVVFTSPALAVPPFDSAQDKPFDFAQDKPFDSAQDKPFDYIPADKWIHLFFSAYATEYCQNRSCEVGQTILIVGGIGILKEGYDYFICKSEFSWSDIFFDLLGMNLALIIN